jgi:hypothetical protein
MILVDDPRVAARELKRPAFRPVPLAKSLCIKLGSWPLSVPDSNVFNPLSYIRSLGHPTQKKIMALLAAEFPEARQPDGDSAHERRRLERIVGRAWAAQNALAQWKTPELVVQLERQVEIRSLHRNFVYHGLDGALAVRALARIHADACVPALIETFWRVDPGLRTVADPRWAASPIAWIDFRIKGEILRALGELRNRASKEFLHQILEMDEGRFREIAVPQFEDVATALLHHNLSLDELRSLLRHRSLVVRGTTVLTCLDHPTRRRTRALKEAAPWALDLPGARESRREAP